MRKTLIVTTACGAAHVLRSVILGSIGIAFGLALHRLDLLEGVRSEIAAWVMIVFGLVYAIWGMKKALRGKLDPAYRIHDSEKDRMSAGSVRHAHRLGEHSITAWGLFIIFALARCEPLIPLLMYPAATHSITGLGWITGMFSIVTIGTMLAVVAFLHRGVFRWNFGRAERYTHSIAGASIACTGLMIRFLGV